MVSILASNLTVLVSRQRDRDTKKQTLTVLVSVAVESRVIILPVNQWQDDPGSNRILRSRT
jgi:hypothetical protein